jgi:SNF2 family DNA or RNA helicase
VFATLKPEQNRIRAVLEREGLRVAMINGDVSMSKRAEIDAKFQRGEIDWIVASPATAGVGFNWQRAAVVVFTSPSYMDDEIVQAYRRAIRGIRETPLPIYLPQYTGTVEDRILEIVEEKSRLAAKVDPTREPLTGLRVA